MNRNDAIRSMRSSGETLSVIAGEFGISTSRVRQICRAQMDGAPSISIRLALAIGNVLPDAIGRNVTIDEIRAFVQANPRGRKMELREAGQLVQRQN